MFALKIAVKYAFSKQGGQRTTAIMTILGIALSITAVLVVAAIMNGLQSSQLDNLRDVESFDLIVNSNVLSKEELEKIEGVEQVCEYLDSNVLISDKSSGKSIGCRVRALNFDTISNTRMKNALYPNVSEDLFEKGATISYLIRRKLQCNPDDSVQFTFLKEGKTATIVPYNALINIVGIYNCSVSDFSSDTVLLSLDQAKSILGDVQCSLGLYLNGSADNVRKSILAIDSDAEVTTWQEYNRSFYSALMLEKAIMYVFLAFMFLILCVNLKNSTNRLINNKKSEGAIIRAVGATRKQICFVFVFQGLLITLIGELAGIVLADIAINNIPLILYSIDKVIIVLTGQTTYLGDIGLNAVMSASEIAFVSLAVFVISLLFVYIGCKRVFKREILEVILNASY